MPEGLLRHEHSSPKNRKKIGGQNSNTCNYIDKKCNMTYNLMGATKGMQINRKCEKILHPEIQCNSTRKSKNSIE